MQDGFERGKNEGNNPASVALRRLRAWRPAGCEIFLTLLPGARAQTVYVSREHHMVRGSAVLIAISVSPNGQQHQNPSV